MATPCSSIPGGTCCSNPPLPVEIWLYIFRLATSPPTELSHHPDFPHVNKDIYQTYTDEEHHESYVAFRVKRKLVRVCRTWNRWCTPLLYEDILIGSYPQHQLLLWTLQQSLLEAASQASLTLILPEPSSEGAKYFEITSPEPAKTMGLGQHVRRITVTKDSGKRPSQNFLPALFLIFQCCPNVISLAACWRKPLPTRFMQRLGEFYGPTLTHLSWHHLHSVEHKISNTAMILPIILNYQSLRVFDGRCFGSNDVWKADPLTWLEGREPRWSLPTVEHIFISSTCRSLSLLSLFKLPSLTQCTLDATGWGYTGQEVNIRLPTLNLAQVAWNSIANSHLTTQFYVQIMADPTERRSIITGLMFTTQLSVTPIPNITKLEIPLLVLVASALTPIIPDDLYNGIATWRPFISLKRLDLRVAAPPPHHERISRLAFLDNAESMNLWYKRISRSRFPILEAVHIVDMTWTELYRTFTPTRQLAAACWKLHIPLYDKHEIMLAEGTVGM